jgi:hypothetical protein
MGPRARVVPTIAIGSDADQAFPASCTHKALEQSLRTNNLVLSGVQDAPFALTPAAVSEEQVPNGLAYSVSTFVDPDGCLVGESWVIHGMPHAWPGGAEYGGYTDTRAPDGAEATWTFLERYRKSETSMPCAEGSTLGPQPPTTSTTTAPTTSTSTRQPTAPPVGSAGPPNRATGTALARTGGGGALAAPAVFVGVVLALGSITHASRPKAEHVRPVHRRA